MDAWAVLQDIKTVLSGIAGVNTCLIGIEAGISPDDYPIIRLVPTRFTYPEHRTHMDLTVYYGMPVVEGDGTLEDVYQYLVSMENEIRKMLCEGSFYNTQFLDTLTDEDRLEQYKLFASRFVISGKGRPGRPGV